MKNATTGEAVRGVGTLTVFVGQADAAGYATCRVEPVPAEGEGCTARVRGSAADLAEFGEIRALAFAAARAWREGRRVAARASRQLAAE